MKRAARVAAAALALCWAPGAMAQTAPPSVFAEIRADDLGESWIERDALPVAVRDNMANPPPSRRCDLNRGQIARLVDALKRAQVLKEMSDGLMADMVIRFRRAGQADLVAVLSRRAEADGKTRIFFDGRLSLLDPADLALVNDVAAEAGCPNQEA